MTKIIDIDEKEDRWYFCDYIRCCYITSMCCFILIGIIFAIMWLISNKDNRLTHKPSFSPSFRPSFKPSM